MEVFIHWVGFVGGWLLVAGPIYQAALELSEQVDFREEFEKVSKSIPQPDRVSRWWWLLPPVHWVLSRRASKDWWAKASAVLTVEQRALLQGFRNKATGWWLVALGALLIASKETWELIEIYHLPTWLFWVAVVVLLVLAGLNTALRMRQTEEFVLGKEAAEEKRQSARDSAATARRSRRRA